MRALAHGRLEIGDLETSFVVAHCGACRSVIHCHALDAWHLANSLFHFVHAQDRQHLGHFDNAGTHWGALNDKPTGSATLRTGRSRGAEHLRHGLEVRRWFTQLPLLADP